VQVAARICETARAAMAATLKIPQPPDSVVHTYIDLHYPALEWSSLLFRRRIRGVSRAAVIAVCADYHERRPQAAEVFVRGLIDGHANEHSPIAHLRTWLIQNADAFSPTTAILMYWRAARQAAIAHATQAPLTAIDPKTDIAWPAELALPTDQVAPATERN
jgi:hypothetical protein